MQPAPAKRPSPCSRCRRWKPPTCSLDDDQLLPAPAAAGERAPDRYTHTRATLGTPQAFSPVSTRVSPKGLVRELRAGGLDPWPRGGWRAGGYSFGVPVEYDCMRPTRQPASQPASDLDKSPGAREASGAMVSQTELGALRNEGQNGVMGSAGLAPVGCAEQHYSYNSSRESRCPAPLRYERKFTDEISASRQLPIWETAAWGKGSIWSRPKMDTCECAYPSTPR